MDHRNIWLISDGSQIFPALSRFFTEKGYQVTTTCHTQEALQAISSGGVPLVITCLSNDWTDTRPFIKAVRERNRGTAVIILRVEPGISTPLDTYLIKGDGYQFTPGGWGGLLQVVANCLNN